MQCVYYHRFIGQLCSLYVGYCTVCCLIVICFMYFAVCYVIITRFKFLVAVLCF